MARTVVSGFRYTRLADDLEVKIHEGVYRSGEKLPSLRKLHRQTGLSITTVYQAYIELEKRGVVVPRQRSGYCVKPMLERILSPPEAPNLRPVPKRVTTNTLAYSIVEDISNPDFLHLGASVVMPDLLPFKQLTRCIRAASLESMKRSLMRYENPYGNPKLKRQITKRMVGQARRTAMDELLITNSCIEAVGLCLQAVGSAGDTVIVESSTYLWFLPIIEYQKCSPWKCPRIPKRGWTWNNRNEASGKMMWRHACWCPISTTPWASRCRRKKIALVKIMAERKIPIIEDNVHGELYFGPSRPTALKSMDRRGLVLHCASFSKTLSSGLRVGWCLPGRFTKKVRCLKLNSTVASPTLNQQVVADF